MSNEILIAIPEKTRSSFSDYEGTYLAEVFSLWDCYAQRWLDGSTMVYRYENQDLLTWLTDEGLQVRCGAVDTTNVDPTILELIGKGDAGDICVCWRSGERYRNLVGEHVNANEILGMLR